MKEIPFLVGPKKYGKWLTPSVARVYYNMNLPPHGHNSNQHFCLQTRHHRDAVPSERPQKLQCGKLQIRHDNEPVHSAQPVRKARS
jgi:hypothetical protein